MSETGNSNAERSKKFKMGQLSLDKARKLIAQEKWTDAEREILASLNYFEFAQTPLIEAQAYLQLGYVYEHLSNWKSAYSAYINCLDRQTNLARPIQISETCIRLAQVLCYLHEYEEAHEYAQKAVDLLENENLPFDKARALYTKGSIYFHEQDFQSAVFYLTMASEEIKLRPEPLVFLKIHENLGIALQAIGKYEDSCESLMQALTIEQSTHNYATIASILESLAENYYHLEQKEKCLNYFQEAVQIRSKIKDSWNQALYIRLLRKYIEALVFFENLQKAEEICEEAISLAESNNLTKELYLSLVLMAKILTKNILQKPDLEEEIQNYLNEAFEIADKEKDLIGKTRVLLQKARIYEKKNQLSKMEEIYAQAESLVKDSENYIAIGEIYEQKGIFYHSQKEYQKALDNFQKSVKAFEKTKEKTNLAEAYYNSACASCHLLLAEDTIIFLKKAIALAPKYKKIALTDDDFASIASERPFRDAVE